MIVFMILHKFFLRHALALAKEDRELYHDKFFLSLDWPPMGSIFQVLWLCECKAEMHLALLSFGFALICFRFWQRF